MPHGVSDRTEDRAGLRIHPFDALARWGVDAFVTERTGGVSRGPYQSLNLGLHVGDEASDVYENRRRVADAIGVGVDRLVIVRQVHSNDVVVAEQATPDTEADVVTTVGTDLAVAVLVENGGDRLSATGGALAAPIGRATIAAALQGAS